MIHFTDGTSITFEQAAQMMEEEGALTRGVYFNAVNRCAIGVLENIQIGDMSFTPERRIKLRGSSFAIDLFTANDSFEGTPEQRAAYMAEWFRSLEEEE